ncbi:MAG TPA: hypothetical protein OIM48_08230 [Clostridiaceae bacterium]|nr:hypothetical protein [Clostridiaceae bacterium]
MRDYKKELKEDLAYGRKNGFKVTLVEANPEKGFSYSYFVYIPNNPQNTIMMDCLNDYEDEMPEGYVENLEGLEEIYSLFEDDEIIRGGNYVKEGMEENKSKTLDRLYYRMEKGVNALSTMISINPNIPAIVPLIPGYGNEQFDSVLSQLDKDVISKTAPQIKAMIEDAKRIIEERANIKMSDKVIPLGHSKSSTFANNFSSYYPEMCEASILGGGDFGTLPVDIIALQIVDDTKITENEQFSLINGVITKKITQTDFDRIMKEYNDTKRDYQDEITANEDGTYNLPMNFPVGISDIEHYRDLSDFPDGKEGFRKALTNMHKMIFIGEQEEIRPGHFAYKDGITKEGIEVKAGDDIAILEKRLGRPVTEIEIASMHNRILEYIATSNLLFGRSSNERLNSYMQLNELLGSPMQSKIYEGVGHANYEYSSDVKELDSISSNSIYSSQSLKSDIGAYYTGAIKGNIPILDNTGRASRISPVYQIIRRYIASRKRFKSTFWCIRRTN